MEKFNIMDLFSGIGGFSLGFKQNNFKILIANEINSEIAESYSKNHKETKMFNCDIKHFINEIKNSNIANKVDIIIGGPPCQGFSLAGKRNRNNTAIIDERNFLFKDFVEVINFIKPKVFIMENVPGIISFNNGKIFEEIINSFSKVFTRNKNQYFLKYKILNAANFGVPQKRGRFFLIGSEIDYNLEEIFEYTRNKLIKNGKIYDVNINDAIFDLNYLTSGEGEHKSNYIKTTSSSYQKEMRINSTALYNHKSTVHSNTSINRIKKILPGENASKLNETIRSIHSGAYGRMCWSEKSKTIITRFDTPSSGRYIHPELNRTITPREAARIQSFPDTIIFYGTKSSIIKQIGNAVPPKLSYFIAEVVKEILKQGDCNEGK